MNIYLLVVIIIIIIILLTIIGYYLGFRRKRKWLKTDPVKQEGRIQFNPDPLVINGASVIAFSTYISIVGALLYTGEPFNIVLWSMPFLLLIIWFLQWSMNLSAITIISIPSQLQIGDFILARQDIALIQPMVKRVYG